MLCMQLLCFYKHSPHLSLFSQKVPFKERRLINPNPYYYSLSSSSYCGRWRVDAVKEREDSESQQHEVDPEKARQALRELDQQLQSLSTKQVPSPKLRPSDVKFRGEERGSVNMREEEVEISGSFLAYTAVALVVFTIFYNFLFYTVIAPSIDGP